MPKKRFVSRGAPKPNLGPSIVSGGDIRDIQQTGREIENAGKALGVYAQDVKRRNDFVYMSKASSEFQQQTMDTMEDLTRNRDTSSPESIVSFKQDVIEKMQLNMTEHIDKAPSQDAKLAFEARARSFVDRITPSVIERQRALSTAATTEALNRVADTDSNFGYEQPLIALEGLKEQLDKNNFPFSEDPDVRKLEESGALALSNMTMDKFNNVYKSTVGTAILSGLVDSDPKLAEQMLESGKFNEILTEKEMRPFRGRIRSRIEQVDLLQRSIFEQGVASNITQNRLTGTGEELKEEAFIAEYGVKGNKGKAKYLAYKRDQFIAKGTHDGIEAIKFADPKDVKHMIEASVKAGEGKTNLTDTLEIATQVTKVADQINAELSKDSANYILNIGKNQVVVQAFQRSNVEGIKALLSLEEKMGIRHGDPRRRILPKEVVTATADFLNQMNDPALFRQGILSLKKNYGEFYNNDGQPGGQPSLYELMSGEGELNANYSFAAAYIEHPLFSVVFEGAKINPQLANKELKNTGDTVVDSMEKIKKKMADNSEFKKFLDVMKISGKGSARMATYIKRLTDVLANSSAVIRLTDPRKPGKFSPNTVMGDDSPEAFLIKELITKKYDLYDTYAIPKDQLNEEESPASEFIETELKHRISNASTVYKGRIAPMGSRLSHLTDDQREEDTLIEIENNGFWANTNDFSGVQLMIKRPDSFDTIPVLDRNGDPIINPFSSILSKEPIADHRAWHEQALDAMKPVLDIAEDAVPVFSGGDPLADSFTPTPEPPANASTADKFRNNKERFENAIRGFKELKR